MCQVTGTMAVWANRRYVINGIRTTLIKRGDMVDLKESTTLRRQEWTRVSAQLAISLGALECPTDDL